MTNQQAIQFLPFLLQADNRVMVHTISETKPGVWIQGSAHSVVFYFCFVSLRRWRLFNSSNNTQDHPSVKLLKRKGSASW